MSCLSAHSSFASEAGRHFRCWAEVDLAALRHNAAVVRELVGRDVDIMAVVKANAYGHGVRQVVEALRDCVDAFGVANLTEARELETTHPVYVLSPPLPDERRDVVEGGFIPFVSSLDEARSYAALAHPNGANIHLMIDTAMGRMGVKRGDAAETVRGILALDGVNLTGICTHLPVADEDVEFTQQQLADYAELVEEIRALSPAAGHDVGVSHVLNSAGIIRFPRQAGEMVRPGLMLYGCSPVPSFQLRLRPVLALITRVTLVREVEAEASISYGRTFVAPTAMRVATLSIGYADGLPRSLSNRGSAVLIRGTRCPLLGRVTMDQIVVDVSHLDVVVPDDEAVIIGAQGEVEITVAEVAGEAGTIAWEVLTRLQRRVVLVYIDAK